MQFFKEKEYYLNNIMREGYNNDGNLLHLRYITGSRHDIIISVEKQGNLVKLSSINLNNVGTILNKYIDEEEFKTDMRRMIGVLSWASAARADIIYPFAQSVHEHIQNYGRLLQDDFETYMLEFILVIDAFAKNESGTTLSETGKMNLYIKCQNFVETEFPGYLQ